jgi:hypothetical protein
MQESANRQRLPVPFTVGDKVELKVANLRIIQQLCSKLRDRNIGRFLITEKVFPVAFLLELPLGVRIHDVVHASRRTNEIQTTKNWPTVRSVF